MDKSQEELHGWMWTVIRICKPYLVARQEGGEFFQALGALNYISSESRRTPLHMAVLNNNEDLILTLIEEGADVNARDDNDFTPLHLATSGGNRITVQTLIEAGADVNSRDQDGMIPLYWAVKTNNENIVKTLIEAGAEVNSRNKYNNTPLHWAVEGNGETVHTLIEAGADVNARDENGWTPLNCVASSPCMEIITQVLIDAGADVNTRDKYGMTPLHFAVNYHNEISICALIAAGADPTLVNDEGKTLEDLTYSENLLSIVRDARIAQEQKELQNSIPDPVPNSNSRRRM